MVVTITKLRGTDVITHRCSPTLEQLSDRENREQTLVPQPLLQASRKNGDSI